MSKLPTGWKFDTFENLGIQIIDGDRGNNYPKQNEFMQEGYCLFLSAKNVTKRGFEFTEKQFISKEKDSLLRKGKLSKGDLVLTTRGTVGNIAFFNDSIKYDNIRINSGMVLLRVSDNVDKLFLYKVMTSDFIQQYIQNIAFGSAQPQLTVKEIKKFQIPLPPLEEQKKIADILTTVDKKIAFVEENINATEELKKGLMQKLLTEGIGHTEFKDSELGRIPESWEVIKLEEVCTKIIGGGTPSKEVEQYWKNGNIFWATVKDMTANKKYLASTSDKITIEGLKNSSTNLIPKMNLITSTRMGLGRFFINTVDMAINQDLKALIIKGSTNLDYTYWVLSSNSKNLEDMGTGTTVKGIKLQDLRNLKIPLPPLEEQKQIAEILSTVDNKLENLKEKKQSFEELKKGLMQKLLTGEVRV
ncbi:restriction endonuclease subunit S [Aliarcobacter cryaerophilus]|uniref:restriction endonuclease subunit S n=1 Tax=Aliarcobacter cryaerophilus TaxID=28198 RepID=UPI0013FD9BF8|nr:restriction endonuclease subunit S [Aliarcobacter cryaerophilus]